MNRFALINLYRRLVQATRRVIKLCRIKSRRSSSRRRFYRFTEWMRRNQMNVKKISLLRNNKLKS